MQSSACGPCSKIISSSPHSVCSVGRIFERRIPMKRIFLAAAMSLSSAFIDFGQTAHNKSAHHAMEEQAVREVEDKIAAALGSNDADALDRLWASDYIFVNPF